MSSIAQSAAFIFSDPWLNDPIMKGLRDGTLSWADAAEMEGLFSVEAAPPSPPTVSPQRVCPGAPTKPHVKFASELRSYAEAPAYPQIPSYTVGIKTIMARNLPRFVTSDLLRATFEKYGSIKDIYIPKNMDQSSQYFGTLKGFALIKYTLAADSAAAFEGEYGQLTIGRNQIAVEFAKADR
jgi:hypothetical protein